MDVPKRHPAQLVGAGVTLLFLALGVFMPWVLRPLELRLYEAEMRLRVGPGAPDGIVVVRLDGGFAGETGGTPWTRSRIAEAVQAISAGAPGVIGLGVALDALEENPALREIDGLLGLLAETPQTQAGGRNSALGNALVNARARLDGDQRLTDAIKAAGVVVLPAFVKPAGDKSAESGAPDDVLASQMIRLREGIAFALLPKASGVSLPLPAHLHVAAGLGHVDRDPGSEDAPRRCQLLYRFGPFHLLPSYALRIAAVHLNIPEDAIQVEGASAIRMGSLEVPLDARGGMLVARKRPAGAYKECACSDVLAGKVPSGAFKDKIVLVSPSDEDAVGLDSGSAMGDFTADAVWSILNGKGVREPGWGIAAEAVMMLVVGAFLALALPGLAGGAAAAVFFGLFALILGSSAWLLAGGGLWIRAAHPLLQLVVGSAGGAVAMLWSAGRSPDGLHEKPSESQAAIGLAFLEEGMLDQAFDRLRGIPVDEEMKGVLYRLALAYEKKRQFDKAAEVLDFIEKYDDGFKDVRKRKLKMLQTADTVDMRPEAASGVAAPPEEAVPPILQETEVRPTLGRYEIIRQLGKGAMGTVYLGQDPRINRITAIKTFRFGSDFEPEEAEKMKKKFFIEAESAGTLSHPNIVTIYDAGEDKGLAFIAMEYLEGEDLQKHTVKGRLLPMRKVIDYVADVADALDYAHQKGIVHRDVKPANIMLLKTGGVKITDFGIARITATSQTQTGVLKGTPYYMSPEQISGLKVDGRSDIFSLGVMLYQLLTANTPFQGDSLASLMNRIIKAPHPDPRRFNPKIVKPLVDVLNKALEKDREKRYQRASEMAVHLRKIGKRMDEIMAEQRSKQAVG